MAQKYKYYLASQSPRRRQLVEKIPINFNILKIKFKEPSVKKQELAKSYLKRCVLAKSSQVLDNIDAIKSNVVLVADTIVDFKGQILGKPNSQKEAIQTLKKLSGGTHYVRTAMALCVNNSQDGRWKQVIYKMVSTQVQFRTLTLKEIKSYVSSHDVLDKAGSYGFQEGGLYLVDRVKGSILNIVGLPLSELETMLLKIQK